LALVASRSEPESGAAAGVENPAPPQLFEPLPIVNASAGTVVDVVVATGPVVAVVDVMVVVTDDEVLELVLLVVVDGGSVEEVLVLVDVVGRTLVLVVGSVDVTTVDVVNVVVVGGNVVVGGSDVVGGTVVTGAIVEVVVVLVVPQRPLGQQLQSILQPFSPVVQIGHSASSTPPVAESRQTMPAGTLPSHSSPGSTVSLPQTGGVVLLVDVEVVETASVLVVCTMVVLVVAVVDVVVIVVEGATVDVVVSVVVVVVLEAGPTHVPLTVT